MKTLLLLTLTLWLHANPTTLMDVPSGFYKNASGVMLPIYENVTCKDEEVINQLPLDAQCIIALERYKNGKARIEYKGQQGWIDVNKNPDSIVLMLYEEMQIPMAFACSQVGPYFFEIKSTQEGKPVKVYEKPSTKSKVISALSDHESCLINLGCEWPWCRIDFGEDTGWVLSINLTDRIQSVDGYCYPREKKALIKVP
jgi:SH3-like domain-containing protein